MEWLNKGLSIVQGPNISQPGKRINISAIEKILFSVGSFLAQSNRVELLFRRLPMVMRVSYETECHSFPR